MKPFKLEIEADDHSEFPPAGPVAERHASAAEPETLPELPQVAEQPETPASTGGALQQLSLLSYEVETWARRQQPEPQPASEPSFMPELPHGEPEAAAPQPSPKAAGANTRLWISRGVKSLVALLLAVLVGWMPMQRLLQTTSAEATVNARLITLRAPIDGQVSPVAAFVMGTDLRSGERVINIENRRADRGRLDDLRRQIAGLKAEQAALAGRRTMLEALKADLERQRDAFQSGRIVQLQARLDEIGAEIDAAESQRAETAASLKRAASLKANGYQSDAVYDRSEREATVAAKALEAARQRQKRATIEIEAARQGIFIAENYNDIPRSQQRVDEMQQQILEVSASMHEREERLKTLEADLVQETARFEDYARAEVTVPADGRVWEVMTAPGEEVHRGQELLRVLDCGGTVVTAAVSEATYNTLRLGGPATFHLRGETREYTGRIIGLNGLATVNANLAIEQNALAREPYHVTVAVPDLGAAPDCQIGRTGKVTFDTSPNAPGVVSPAVAKPVSITPPAVNP